MKIFKNLTLLLAVAGIVTISSCSKDDLPSGDACFTVTPSTVEANETVTFSNCSNFSSSYSWDFGDGSSSSLKTPTHSYTSSGIFTVRLTVKNDDGFGNSVTKTVTVNDKIPVNMIINSITLTKWPATDNGSAWDNSTYPDIYPVVIQNTNTIFSSSVYFENCAPGNSFEYGIDSGFPLTIGSLNEKLTIAFYDHDLATSDDWMGGIEFTPAAFHVTGANHFTITVGEYSFVVGVSWVY